MLAVEKYESALGIGINSKSLLSFNTINKETDVFTNSLKERTYKRLIDIKACDSTGLNIKELMDLPTYELKTIIVALTNSNLIKAEAKLAKDFNKALRR